MQRQSLIFRLGPGDTRLIQEAGSGVRVTEVQLLDRDSNLDFGIGPTIKGIHEQGLEVTETGADLLLIASAIYAADKRLSRTEISQDGWTREIDLHLPVSSPGRWNSLRAGLERMLGFLTGDLWRLAFRPQAAAITELAEYPGCLGDATPSEICLFSGGLDSFIGAVDLLEQGREPLLVSHSWVASDSSHQSTCIDALREQYGIDQIRQVRSRIGFGEHDLRITEEGETTERSRSFLFFAIAAAVASGLATTVPVVVPENGLISLNIPLDPLRLGAFSTRTTHPYFVARFNELLTAIGIPTQLVNPYRHRTKGEMVTGCRNQALLQASVANTVSCSSVSKARWQGNAPGHCGHCVPCIIRRAALMKLGIPDPTSYVIGPLTGKRLPSNQADGEHVRSFQFAIHRLNKNRDTAHILVEMAGPLPDYPGELEAYANLYCRGLGEVEQLLLGVKTAPHV